jgi:hypothetical protein
MNLEEAEEEDVEEGGPEQEVPPQLYPTYNKIYSLGGSIDNMGNLTDSLHDTMLNMSQKFDQRSQAWGPSNYQPPPR